MIHRRSQTRHAAPDLGRAQHWTDLGTPCVNDPELFHAPGGNWDHHQAQAEEAKAVCRTCPAIDACLTWALDTAAKHSIAGGMTPNERDRYRRTLARKSRSKSA